MYAAHQSRYSHCRKVDNGMGRYTQGPVLYWKGKVHKERRSGSIEQDAESWTNLQGE